MIKQLILAATLLLIYDSLKVIQYARDILNFVMLAQYISYDNETLRYMKHILYNLEIQR